MGTPSLWSDIAVHLDCWPGYNPNSQLYLLKAALERGAGRPLTISFISDRRLSAVPESSLALLADHCRRWQHLHLFVDSFADLNKIACVKGKLDSLQTLSLSSWSEQAFFEDIDIFERAPQLSGVSFGAVNPRCCPRLPWRQLQTFTYHFGQTVDFAAALSLMCNLSHPEAGFEVRHLNAGRRFDLPAITSSVASFLLTVYAASTSQAVGEVLSSLTLPHLRELSVNSSSNISPAMWPTTQFAALSHRSAFSTTLRSLDIRYVTIADDDLILSLSSPASLESLVISDQQSTKTAVTDVLLRRLALTSDPSSCLVPQLKFFDCTSSFLFSPPLYYEFIASRVVPGTAPFRAVLRGLFAYPSARDTFNRETFRMLFDLVASGSLQFQLAERYKVD
ncbi:hypothetical protein C8R43DRAFT_1108186 [Mycena crocata]|nr:hypothetical protein C8R43DRAFT_1108186 [Mycena crocata]